MKRFEKVKKKIAVIANILLAIQLVSFGLLGSGTVNAAVATLVIDSPTEGQSINSLSVTVNGHVNLDEADEPSDYKVEVDFSDDTERKDSSLSGDTNTWSMSKYTYPSSGDKWISVNLLKKLSGDPTKYESVLTSPTIVHFSLVYPSKPATPVVTGELGIPHDNPVANFKLDWDDNPEEDYITYKAAYAEKGSAEYKMEEGASHHSSETEIKDLKPNTEYEFVVYAFKGDSAVSEPSDPASLMVKNITSKAASPEYSTAMKFDVPFSVVEGDAAFDYAELWYKGPEDNEFKRFEQEGKEGFDSRFDVSPISFEATEEGTYLFYTVAVDESGFSEKFGTCVGVLGYEVHALAENGGKCLPDSRTIVDITAPKSVTDLKAVASNARVDLSWTLPTDEISGILRTDIYRNNVKLPVVVSGNTFADLNVVNGTTYSYFVVVYDKAGNPLDAQDGKSNVVSATPVGPVATPVVSVARAETSSFSSNTDTSNSIENVDQKEGEVKSDTDDKKSDENSEEKNETKEKRNIPLWGIIFLLVLAGIGGYLFYSQGPETDKKKKK